jgi:chemotaxis protein MotB
MSADGDAEQPHEVIIVRRRSHDDDDGHHGGAWKIAFADLMTAMMTFFLVMWLLSATDKEKIQKIATYFNPIKLNSKKPTSKGIEEEQDIPKSAAGDTSENAEGGTDTEGDEGKKGNVGARRKGGDGEEAEGRANRAEEELFNDPYGVLARLALKANEGEQQSGGGKDNGLMPGGDTYSNPFEPFSQRKAEPEKSETLLEPSPLSPEEPARPSQGDIVSPPAPGLAPAAVPEQQQQLAAQAPQPAPGAPETLPNPTQQPALTNTAAEPAGGGYAQAVDAAVKELQQELQAALAAVPDDKKPNVEVKAESEGVLINLTDDFRFGMFSMSSAEPTPALVLVMDKVAKILAGRKGGIVVRGHTDSRPYKTQKNNNWRLSMSRAQMAYYMLVRGGVQESRIDRIEGHADRDLFNPADPFAAQNRRIEILLKVPNP